MAKRPSKIDRLPEEVQTLIGKLRRNGRTIDEIMAKLGELDLDALGIAPDDLPSRAAIGRHVQELDAMAEEMRRQKTIAEAMVERGLVMDQGQTAKLNIALAHGLLTRLMFTGNQPATLDAEEAMFVARSIQSLASAAKADTDRELKVRAEVAKETKAASAKAAETIAREKGLSADTVAAIKASILGVQLPPKGT